jgi:arylsulfatase A-like enzyme
VEPKVRELDRHAGACAGGSCTRKIVAMCVLFGAAVVAAMLGVGGADPADDIRRVVVIHLDTTRVDDLGCYGGIADTPNIDAVAARGMRFTNAIAPTPRTSPSIASFMTGRLANRHGVYDVGGKLGAGYATLAEILRDHGFVTGGFTTNAVIDRLGGASSASAGFDQGFDAFRGFYTSVYGPDEHELNAIPRALCPDPVNAAIDFIDRCGDERFFLWMLHLDPHAPYAPEPPYDTMYLDHPTLLAGSVRLQPEAIHPQAYVGSRLDSHEYVARHLGEVTQLDHWLGKLFAKLDGLPGRTLLVVTADHGESLGDAGIWFSHGRNIRHPCVNVPLIIACDGVVPAGVTDTLTANVDLAPTILDLLGLPAGALDADGRTLAPAFTDADPWPDRMIPIQRSIGAKWRGVRSARFCLQSRFDQQTHERVEATLYDRVADPTETTDVAARHPDVFEAHLRFEDDWFARGREVGEDLRDDPEMVRRLRSLGYLK